MVIRGNLLVVGNTSFTTIQSEQIEVQDNMIFLNANLTGQDASNNDIGWFGQTTVSTVTGNITKYVGVAWDVNHQEIRMFDQFEKPKNKLTYEHGLVQLHVGRMIVASELSVGGTIKPTGIRGDLSITGNTIVGNNTQLSKLLSVGMTSNFSQELSVQGETTLSSILSVGSFTTIKQLLSVGGNVTFTST